MHADHNDLLSTFVVVCVTGPVLGIIVGSAIIQKYAGGYEGKHASTISIVYAVSAMVCSFPVRMISTTHYFGLCLWAVLFFGGAVIPNVQGIMISSLRPELRGAGNSISNIFFNLIGFLPAPFVYGFIYNKSKDYDPKLAITVTLWYSSVGVVLLCIGTYYRFKQLDDKRLSTLTMETEVKKDNAKEIVKDLERKDGAKETEMQQRNQIDVNQYKMTKKDSNHDDVFDNNNKIMLTSGKISQNFEKEDINNKNNKSDVRFHF